MSIVSLTDGTLHSDLTLDLVQNLCDGLNVGISNEQDAKDYLRLLQSFEAVMSRVDRNPDYIHPALEPVPVSGDRHFWKPTLEENPFNAWSHRCSLRSTNPDNQLLSGYTVAIKDNISVGGVPTTLGTFALALSNDGTFPPSTIDATVVSRILRAGSEIKGTSTCESFCASPLSFTSATGPVHNPRLRGYTAGGSSSGSSALVAAHVMAHERGEYLGSTVTLAMGSDQAGSVRIPASYNGIYGLKPTFGLVPYTGATSMSPMIDHLGPLASNLEDIAAILEVMAGYDGIDPRMTPESPLLHQVKRYSQILADYRERLNSSLETLPLRVGLLTESFHVSGVAPQVRDTVYKAASLHFGAAGATVVDVSIPMHLEGPVLWTASTRPSMYDWLCKGKSSGYLNYLTPHIEPRWPPSQDMLEQLTSSNPAVVNIILSGLLNDARYKPSLEAKAHRKVFELRAAYDRALEDVDVLITPCAPTIAMPHPGHSSTKGEEQTILERLSVAIGLTSNTCPFNVTGHPALSVPCGSSCPPEHAEVQLPIGMQIIGRRWDDEQVIMAAALFEKGRELNSSSAS
ncbi:hypothetical protein ACHAPT_012892 [Fusarium lateritium]